MPHEGLTRDAILRALADALKPLPFVHALYEGGAVSRGRLDPWSDLDVYALVDDDKVPEAVAAIEAALARLSPIQQKCEVKHPPADGTWQAFYRLERASEYLLVDLAVLKVSAPDRSLVPDIHGPAVVHFDKTGVTAPPPLDVDAHVKRLMERLERLRARTDMFSVFVQKEINRENWIEAVDLYRGLVLDALLEVLRMRHGPLHFDFKTRYVHQELPPDIVRRYVDLAFVRDPADLQAKFREASDWFRQVAGEIDEAEIRKRLSQS